MRVNKALAGGVALVAAAVAPAALRAQEIEPRAFSPSPVGVTFVVAAYGRSTGGILTDPSLPVDDVEAEIDGSAIGVGHTFSFFGRSASIAVLQPRASGHFTGTLNGEDAEASRSGLGDTKVRFATNLLGGPALSAADFAKRRPGTTIGASLTVSAPTGEYHPDKLINVGSNRWAIKPEVGIAHPIGRWYVEGVAGVWVFGDNDEFFGGQHREQDPLASLQGHLSYVFRPSLWLAVNAIWYEGGRSTLNGVAKDDRQSNSRYGLTLSVPLGRTQSLKFTWNDGASTRIGSDFTSYGIAWQYTHLP
jgi:hypothetical protein